MRIVLRPLKEEDVTEAYLRWFADEAVTAYLEARNLTRQQVLDYRAEGLATRRHFLYAIMDKASGAHIGTVKIGPIHWGHKTSDLVTLIGERAFWGQGLAAEAIALGNQLAFETYGLRKLSGGVIEGNIGSLKAYAKAGWVEEGRLKAHYLVDGLPRDRIMISCFNPLYSGPC